MMQGYLAILALGLTVAMVIVRVLYLRSIGIEAFHFGRSNKSDYLLPPLALFYVYTIVAAALDLPLLSDRRFFNSEALGWAGVVLCFLAPLFMLLSLISFGSSFRVGIDEETPDQLITTGIFAYSRNPIYVGFVLMLLGQFLVFPNWVPLIYLLAGLWLIHRQVLREEAFLSAHYGREYEVYRARVRRYL